MNMSVNSRINFKGALATSDNLADSVLKASRELGSPSPLQIPFKNDDDQELTLTVRDGDITRFRNCYNSNKDKITLSKEEWKDGLDFNLIDSIKQSKLAKKLVKIMEIPVITEEDNLTELLSYKPNALTYGMLSNIPEEISFEA